MANYYRNVDDAFSDPELIMAKYRIGRSVFFEVSLTLAEYADNIRSAGGGSSSQTPTYIESLGLEDPNVGCPREDQFVWVGEPGGKPRPVKAGSLLKKKGWCLYNPLTRNFNKLRSAELLDEAPMLKVTTEERFRVVVSQSHMVIRNTADLAGTRVATLKPKDELLCMERVLVDGRVQWAVLQDRLGTVKSAGKGRAVKVELETEFIYAAGSDPDRVTLAHNVKLLTGESPF